MKLSQTEMICDSCFAKVAIVTNKIQEKTEELKKKLSRD